MIIFMLLFRLTTKTCYPNYLCTCPQMYLFITLPVDFILAFRLTVKIYPSIFPHVHRCTCLSVYLFSLFLIFQHNMHNELSTHPLGYLHTDPPKINLPVYLHASLSTNHEDLPVSTTACVTAHRRTRS